ncbi:MAG: hypothetical protein KGV44_10910 [Flavobacteriaceae bacterium]|nr:hypothetical protein [Flavobacteriaceae bacterium]
MKKLKKTQTDRKKDKCNLVEIRPKSMRMGTKEDLKKMQEELDWSLDEWEKYTGKSAVNRKPHYEK